MLTVLHVAGELSTRAHTHSVSQTGAMETDRRRTGAAGPLQRPRDLKHLPVKLNSVHKHTGSALWLSSFSHTAARRRSGGG